MKTHTFTVKVETINSSKLPMYGNFQTIEEAKAFVGFYRKSFKYKVTLNF